MVLSKDPSVEELLKDNDRLRRRVKLLERRLKKFKNREETLLDEIEELDVEAASNVPLYEPNKEGRCKKCGSKAERLDIPGKTLLFCNKCGHREVEI